MTEGQGKKKKTVHRLNGEEIRDLLSYLEQFDGHDFSSMNALLANVQGNCLQACTLENLQHVLQIGEAFFKINVHQQKPIYSSKGGKYRDARLLARAMLALHGWVDEQFDVVLFDDDLLQDLRNLVKGSVK